MKVMHTMQQLWASMSIFFVFLNVLIAFILKAECFMAALSSNPLFLVLAPKRSVADITHA